MRDWLRRSKCKPGTTTSWSKRGERKLLNRFTKALVSETRLHLSCQEMITDIKSLNDPKDFHLVRSNASDRYEEARHFDPLLRSAGTVDILCSGIGTSGHLALNEPFQTDFNDRPCVKGVNIAEQSKRQPKKTQILRSLATSRIRESRVHHGASRAQTGHFDKDISDSRGHNDSPGLNSEDSQWNALH
jgi:hypothetical protein